MKFRKKFFYKMNYKLNLNSSNLIKIQLKLNQIQLIFLKN
jgi:hypothetical protein